MYMFFDWCDEFLVYVLNGFFFFIVVIECIKEIDNE